MDSMPFSHKGKWLCKKCNTWAQNTGGQKCAWCGTAKPKPKPVAAKEEPKVDPDVTYKKDLVESVQKLNATNVRKILKQVKIILDEQ